MKVLLHFSTSLAVSFFPPLFPFFAASPFPGVSSSKISAAESPSRSLLAIKLFTVILVRHFKNLLRIPRSTQVAASLRCHCEGGTHLPASSPGPHLTSVYSSALLHRQAQWGEEGRGGGGKHWWQLVAETPRANPINLLILLFLALGYVFLPNTESIQAKCGQVSGAGNVFSVCQNRGVG